MKQNKSVLVIDDELGIRQLFGAVLRQQGIEVILAENGADGLEASLQRPYDLVFVDVNLPRMKGTEVLRRLREERPEQRIVMMSGNLPRDSALAGLPANADWLSKPFGYHELLAMLNKHLGPSIR